MHCPFCSADDTKVIDSRLVAEGGQVRRRRECLSCKERFTTFEMPELLMPRVIKRDETREPFDEDKLRAGLLRALEKRPVDIERIEGAISHIQHQLRATGEREVTTRMVGELVMEQLRELDEVPDRIENEAYSNGSGNPTANVEISLTDEAGNPFAEHRNQMPAKARQCRALRKTAAELSSWFDRRVCFS